MLPDAPRPFASPRADQLAAHVRVLELGVYPLSECQAGPGKVSPFPLSMPNLRTLRLNLHCDGETDPLHSDLSANTPALCQMVHATPHKLVIHGIHSKFRFEPVLQSLRGTLPGHSLANVRELVYLFDPDIDVDRKGRRARLLEDWHQIPHSNPAKFTILLWTKNRGDPWIPAGAYHPQTTGLHIGREQPRVNVILIWSIFYVLFCHPAPEMGEPLITIVNVGAIPLLDASYMIGSMLNPQDLHDNFTVDERALKIEKLIRAHFERLCGPDNEASGGVLTHTIKPDIALKSVKESMRFISMDEYLAEPGALDAFDEDALAGWK